MRIVIDVLLDEQQVKAHGITPEFLKEELYFTVSGAMNPYTNPRWPTDTTLDHEISMEIVK